MKLRRVPLLIAAAAAVLLGLPSAAIFYTDLLWFREVGFESVFFKTINSEVAVFAATTVVSFSYLFVNWRIAHRALLLPHLVFRPGATARPVVLDRSAVGGI